MFYGSADIDLTKLKKKSYFHTCVIPHKKNSFVKII